MAWKTRHQRALRKTEVMATAIPFSMHIDCLMPNRTKTYSAIRKTAIALIGGTVVLFGIALIVLPGPAFIVIPAGLAILATEFVWAKRSLEKAKLAYRKQRDKFKRSK